jgi:hypothetical protein
MDTRVIIPVSPDGLKPRAASFEGLLDADGLGIEAVGEDPVEDEELAPVALDLKASKVLSAVGLTAKTIPALQWAPCLQ